MLSSASLRHKWASDVTRRSPSASFDWSQEGVTLGYETVLAKGAEGTLTLAGQEARILALLSAAHNDAVDPDILRHFRAAERLCKAGMPIAAHIALIHSRFPPLPASGPQREEALWRLYAAAELIDWIAPEDVLRHWGYGETLAKYEALAKYSPDEPRDDYGRWRKDNGDDDLPSVKTDHVLPNAEGYAGSEAYVNTAGEAQCVELLKQALGAPDHTHWSPGMAVSRDTPLTPGTAIATFDENGHYPNNSTGQHAAIYLGQDDTGVQILEQYVPKGPHDEHPKIKTNTLYWSPHPGSPSTYNPAAYRTVQW